MSKSKAVVTSEALRPANHKDTHCPGCSRELSNILLYPCPSCEAESLCRSITPDGLNTLLERARRLNRWNKDKQYSKLLIEYIDSLWLAMELGEKEHSASLAGLLFPDRTNDAATDLDAARNWVSVATSILRGTTPPIPAGRKNTQNTLSTEQENGDDQSAKHNADFTMVSWFGTEYQFALGVQSSAVKALWEEWEKTNLGLSQQTICQSIDSERDNFRMNNAFRNHSAMGTMIQTIGKGLYRLVKPV